MVIESSFVGPSALMSNRLIYRWLGSIRREAESNDFPLGTGCRHQVTKSPSIWAKVFGLSHFKTRRFFELDESFATHRPHRSQRKVGSKHRGKPVHCRSAGGSRRNSLGSAIEAAKLAHVELERMLFTTGRIRRTPSGGWVQYGFETPAARTFNPLKTNWRRDPKSLSQNVRLVKNEPTMVCWSVVCHRGSAERPNSPAQAHAPSCLPLVRDGCARLSRIAHTLLTARGAVYASAT